MGLFGRKKKKFTPNFSLSEYENWLSFLNSGGTSSEWEQLKQSYNWMFTEEETETLSRYNREIDSISNRYYEQLQKIQKSWSTMYNLGAYSGVIAHKFEKDCLANISDYKMMRAIDKKYGKKTPVNVPALKRLAMLYEKQGQFEKSVDICKLACSLGVDEKSRMIRMIKKAGRLPTEDEMAIIENIQLD